MANSAFGIYLKDHSISINFEPGTPLRPDDRGSEVSVLHEVLQDEGVVLLGVNLHHADVGKEGGGVVGAEERHQLHSLDSRARAERENGVVRYRIFTV